MKALLCVMLLAAVMAGPVAAQPSYPAPPRPPRPTLGPAFTPCIDYPHLPAVMGPCQGPVNARIAVRLRRNLGAPAALLSFKAVVSRGVPARVHTRLQGQGLDYWTVAPPQLCMQGGGSWEAELVLANGQNVGVIGGYTPSNCPR